MALEIGSCGCCMCGVSAAVFSRGHKIADCFRDCFEGVARQVTGAGPRRTAGDLAFRSPPLLVARASDVLEERSGVRVSTLIAAQTPSHLLPAETIARTRQTRSPSLEQAHNQQ